MFFGPMRSYAAKHGIEVQDAPLNVKNSTVLMLSDYLTPDYVEVLKQNGNRIVGFNVTDSAYISESCRAGDTLKKIDLMFMLSGVQRVNYGFEFIIDPKFNVSLEGRQFLPADDWVVFSGMRAAGRLQSLPYVHWNRQPNVDPKPFPQRSQQALIRGGGQLRRFVLALFLMQKGGLDINSGFFTRPYFEHSMNPQWRYCDSCRTQYWQDHARYRYRPKPERGDCNSPAQWEVNLNKHGIEIDWNNRCPKSFYWLAEQFEKRHGTVDKGALETLMNGQFMDQRQHLEILSRMAFSADFKWIFSIFAPQRFWDAALVGTLNYLPERTAYQDYFPVMKEGEHYLTFKEDFSDLSVQIEEAKHQNITHNARVLYDQWIRPSEFNINTNLLEHIFKTIEKV